MANQATSSRNPNVIDTFGADVIIGGTSGVRQIVSSIVLEGATAGDTATFIDGSGNEVLRLSTTANNGSIVWSPAVPFSFSNGLTFDDSASSLASNDFVFVYLA